MGKRWFYRYKISAFYCGERYTFQKILLPDQYHIPGIREFCETGAKETLRRELGL
jgi:hypothetical protein